MLVRLVGMAGFIYFAYSSENRNFWYYLWIFSAILINPFIKIPLGRFLWNITDVTWAILLLISIFLKNMNNFIFIINIYLIYCYLCC
jgi:hypothetical protein